MLHKEQLEELLNILHTRKPLPAAIAGAAMYGMGALVDALTMKVGRLQPGASFFLGWLFGRFLIALVFVWAIEKGYAHQEMVEERMSNEP